MTWLDEIEANNKEFREEILDGSDLALEETEKERMARVIRELVRFILVSRATNDQREIAIAYDDICSPEVKELLNETPAPSSTRNPPDKNA